MTSHMLRDQNTYVTCTDLRPSGKSTEKQNMAELVKLVGPCARGSLTATASPHHTDDRRPASLSIVWPTTLWNEPRAAAGSDLPLTPMNVPLLELPLLGCQHPCFPLQQSLAQTLAQPQRQLHRLLQRQRLRPLRSPPLQRLLKKQRPWPLKPKPPQRPRLQRLLQHHHVLLPGCFRTETPPLREHRRRKPELWRSPILLRRTVIFSDSCPQDATEKITRVLTC